jgi:hypothetical protein
MDDTLIEQTPNMKKKIQNILAQTDISQGMFTLINLTEAAAYG